MKIRFSEKRRTGEVRNSIKKLSDCTKALWPVWQKKKGLQISNPANVVWSTLMTCVWVCCTARSSWSLHGTADNTKITKDNMTDNTLFTFFILYSLYLWKTGRMEGKTGSLEGWGIFFFPAEFSDSSILPSFQSSILPFFQSPFLHFSLMCSETRSNSWLMCSSVSE